MSLASLVYGLLCWSYACNNLGPTILRMCTYLTIPDDWNWVCWWCWWVWLNCLCCCCLEWWYEEEEEDELVFGWTLLAFGWWLPLPPPPPVTDVTDIPEVALEDDTELIGETKFPPPPLPPPPPWLRKLQQVGNAQYLRSTTNTGVFFFQALHAVFLWGDTFEGKALVSLRKIGDNSLSPGKSKGQNSLSFGLILGFYTVEPHVFGRNDLLVNNILGQK